ncbi:Galactose-1-phosphate uridylyltransferase [Eumeta japonica]|uniref:Galactose-1-phosphate uridylyltransferase n=1 Tax=Eumeta variegata TaxID=151549 RepID=A0A4C1THM8_EUMVA|nr:Galactose-1-phosphate uridylyltransferase [Eumeta japonica]
MMFRAEHQHIRYNPLKQEWVLVSPHRCQRPWSGQTEKPEDKTADDDTNPLKPGAVRSSGQVDSAVTKSDEVFGIPSIVIEDLIMFEGTETTKTYNDLSIMLPLKANGNGSLLTQNCRLAVVCSPRRVLWYGARRSNKNPLYTSTYVFPNDFPALLERAPQPDDGGDPLFRVAAAKGTCRVPKPLLQRNAPQTKKLIASSEAVDHQLYGRRHPRESAERHPRDNTERTSAGPAGAHIDIYTDTFKTRRLFQSDVFPSGLGGDAAVDVQRGGAGRRQRVSGRMRRFAPAATSGTRRRRERHCRDMRTADRIGTEYANSGP